VTRNPYSAPKANLVSEYCGNRERNHPFVAGVFDFYSATLLFGAVLAGVTAVRPDPIGGEGVLALLGLSLPGSIFYHLLFAKRMARRSPGEILVGTRLVDGSKRWSNPYRANRFFLFAVSLLILVIVGNAWDGLGDGVIYTPGVVLVRSLVLFGFVTGLAAVGNGRSIAASIVMLGLAVWGANAPLDASGDYVRLFFVGIAGLYGLVVISHHVLGNRRKMAEQKRRTSALA